METQKENSTLFIALLTSFLVTGVGGFLLEGKLSDALINVSASLLLTLLTLYGIEKFLTKEKERRLQQARAVTFYRLSGLASMLVSQVNWVFNFGLRLDTTNNPEKTLPIPFIKDALERMQQDNLRERVASLNKKNWIAKRAGFDLARVELRERIRLYNDLVPPDVLGALLNVESAATTIYLYLESVTENSPADESIDTAPYLMTVTVYLHSLDNLVKSIEKHWSAFIKPQ